jgi:hypothetical protein
MPESINKKPARSTRIKVTKRSVESLPTGERPAIWYDDKLAGFGVRVMPSGRRYYFARYRNKYGRSRWFTIGEHGEVTAEAACTKAPASPANGCRRWERSLGRTGGLPRSADCQ